MITEKTKKQILKEGADPKFLEWAIATLQEEGEDITPTSVREYVCIRAREQYNLRNHPNPNQYAEFKGRLGRMMNE